MGTGYQIDLGSMNQLVSTLKSAAQSITDANTALQNASTDQLGNADLNSAGSDFKDRWDYGTGKISDLTGKMTDALGATVKAYGDAENQIAQSFTAPPSSAANPTQGQAPPGGQSTSSAAGSRISTALTGSPAS